MRRNGPLEIDGPRAPERVFQERRADRLGRTVRGGDDRLEPVRQFGEAPGQFGRHFRKGDLRLPRLEDELPDEYAQRGDPQRNQQPAGGLGQADEGVEYEYEYGAADGREQTPADPAGHPQCPHTRNQSGEALLEGGRDGGGHRRSEEPAQTVPGHARSA